MTASKWRRSTTFSRRSIIYFRDSGILHRLLGIPGMEQMVTHPRMGASWEGFALEHLKLDTLTIVCPGNADYPLDERIQVTGLSKFTAGQ